MKNVLIIGGTKGIGLELANNLADSNNVTVVARQHSDSLNSNIKFHSMDALNQQFSYSGEILDALIYCPGTINLKPFNRLAEDDFLEDFKVNLLGAVKVIQENIQKLKNSDNASILLFSSVAANQGMPFHTSVSASKAAVEGFAKSLAAELAPQIRVNVIAPSITNTPLASKLLSNDDKIVKSGERHPLKRVGQPSDIAAAAEYLISNKSSWVTGQVMAVDGGMSSLRLL